MREELVKTLLEFENRKPERYQPFLTDTDDKKQYFDNLLTLQDDGYITGIIGNGIDHINRNYKAYIISQAELTLKGKNFIESYKKSGGIVGEN